MREFAPAAQQAKRESGRIRLALASAVTLFAVFLLVAPAAEAHKSHDPILILSGSVVVDAGHSSGDVVIGDGPVIVRGKVEGSVVAFNGDVTVTGEVTNDIVAFNGQATVGSKAKVGGNVTSSEEPFIAPGAAVGGDVSTVDVSSAADSFGLLAPLLLWLFVAISAGLLGVLLLALFPRAVSSSIARGRDAVGASAGFGALIFFGVPLVGVILLFTIVAIPLGVGLLLITLPLHALGYVIAMFILGRLIIKQPSSIWLAFLVGWILLSIVSLIPFAGSLIGFIASFYGLGAIFVAAWRVRKDGVATADQPPAALPTS